MCLCLVSEDLLLHFFNFYAYTFNNHTSGVCIKNPGKMSRAVMADQAHEFAALQRGKLIIRNFHTPLVVQDPFDLSHNVTRNLTPNLWHCFKSLCENSVAMLRCGMLTPSPMTVRSLFSEDQSVQKKEEVETVAVSTSEDKQLQIVLSQDEIFHILLNDNDLSVVGDRLAELDWTSIEVQCGLGQLVLVHMIRILESKLDFTCSQVYDSLEEAEEEQDEPEKDRDSQDTTLLESVTESALGDVSGSAVENVSENASKDVSKSALEATSDSTNQCVSENTLEEVPEFAPAGVSKSTSEYVTKSTPEYSSVNDANVVGKRLHESSDRDSVTSKRSKVDGRVPSALEVLQELIASSGYYCDYVCSSDLVKLSQAKHLKLAVLDGTAEVNLPSVDDIEGEHLELKIAVTSCSVKSVTFSVTLCDGEQENFQELVGMLTKLVKKV